MHSHANPHASDPPIVVLGLGDSAAQWAGALCQDGLMAVVADPFTFVPPSSFPPSPIRLAVIDSALDVAPNLLQALRAANVPVILATNPRVLPQHNPPRDPLTHYGSWLADAYVGSLDELVYCVPIVLDSRIQREGQALHLTYRGSVPPQEVGFPIGTAFPLREGVALFLGRSRTLAVQLASPHVGRVHALVAALPGNERRALAVDLQSHNGTYVKGRRVTLDFIGPGEELAIAGYRFVVEVLPDYTA